MRFEQCARVLAQLVAAPLCLLSLDLSARAEAGCETPDIDFKFLPGEMSPSALPFVREIPVAIRGAPHHLPAVTEALSGSAHELIQHALICRNG